MPDAKYNNAAGDEDLNIEVQQNLSRLPSFTSTVADFGFEGVQAQKKYFDRCDYVGDECSDGTCPTRGHGEKGGRKRRGGCRQNPG